MAGGGVSGGGGTSAEESALEQLREVAAAATKRLQAALDEKEMENASLQKQLQVSARLFPLGRHPIKLQTSSLVSTDLAAATLHLLADFHTLALRE